MNNQQIITDIAVSMYGQAAVAGMLADGREIPLHTAKGWADRGYRIKKGEHGIKTRLWKKKKNVEEEDDQNAYYMAKSFLFSIDQVERKEA